MTRVLFILFVLTFSCAGVAKAGWQNTEWGMNKNQFQDAIKKNSMISIVPENYEKPDSDKLLFYGISSAFYGANVNSEYSLLNAQLTPIYNNKEKLVSVRLTLDEINGNCYRLLDVLTSIYGSPLNNDTASDFFKGAKFYWRDEQRENFIVLSSGGKNDKIDFCVVTYNMLSKPNEVGGF